MIIPHRTRGRQSKEAIEKYERDLMSFCNEITQINSNLILKFQVEGGVTFLKSMGF